MAFFANGSLTNLGMVNPMTPGKQVGVNNSMVNDPELIGPDRLCIVFGSIIGDFFGTGDPVTDVYSWKIYSPANQLLFNGAGGAGFQTISYTFSLAGTHRVELEVKRAGVLLLKKSKNVELIKGPDHLLKPDYTICVNQELEVFAIDPSSSNFSNYKFEWKDPDQNIISNTNTAKISKPGKYSVIFYFESGITGKECEVQLSTEVSILPDFSIVGTSGSVCPDGTLLFKSDPEVFGEWFVQKNGDPVRKSLGNGNSVTISPGEDLNGYGDYEIILLVSNSNNPSCSPEKKENFIFNPLPQFEFVDAAGSSGCLNTDGALRIRALTPIDQLSVLNENIYSPPLNPGDIYEFPGLLSGAYTIIGVLGNCVDKLASVVPLGLPPPELLYTIDEITGEACTPIGKEEGSFLVKLINGPLEGSYRILGERGGVVKNEALGLDNEFKVSIGGGNYYFEIYDKDSCSLPKSELITIPSRDQVSFSVPASLAICQSFDLIPETNQSLEFTLTTPSGQIEVQPSGKPFILTEEGNYKILGVLPNQSDICPTQKEFTITLVNPVQFEPTLIEQDCFGNRTYEANIFGRDPGTVKFTWFNEKDEIVGTGQTLFPISLGEYKLDVQPANSSACPIPPKSFLIEAPVLKVDVTLKSTQLCELGPGAVISLETTFFEEVTDIEWRRYTELGEIVPLPLFKDQTEITVFESGTYEASVFSIIPSINKDCELGRNTIDLVINPNKIDFTIPATIAICETYEFTPETTQDLTFEITYPNGETTTRQSGEPLVLNQKGTYLFLGISNDAIPTLCPELKSMEVTIFKKIPFAPELFQETCDGTKTYRANIGTISPALADFFWFDESGNVIGTEEFLTLNSYGNFTLDVQPKGSIPCDQVPVSFIVGEPILELAVDLIAEPLCPDAPSAAIRAETQFELVNRIEWWFTKSNGVETQLSDQTNKGEVLAFEEGTYEVRIFNQINCLLGFDRVLVMRSMDAVRPEVKESYLICPRYEIAETINPGQFTSYEWYHEGILVSTSPTYKPLLIGNFELIVFSAEGCAYQTTFITEEECELKVSFPNAIQPGNPDKQFLIYTNYLIDELEVFVFSKWGEVIFQCASSDLISEASTCPWDGTFAGKGIPPGSYAIRINFKNLEKNISKYYLGSVLIIE